LAVTDAKRVKKPKLPKKRLLKKSVKRKGRWRLWLASRGKASRWKTCFRLSSARNVAQQTYFGLRACLSSGRCGNAETAVIEEH